MPKSLNLKWVADVTEFSLFRKKLCLSPILDLHSSDLVSHTISDRPDPPFRLGLAIPAQTVSEDAPEQKRPAEHEPEGKLSGQCCYRELLRITHERVA